MAWVRGGAPGLLPELGGRRFGRATVVWEHKGPGGAMAAGRLWPRNDPPAPHPAHACRGGFIQRSCWSMLGASL